MMHRKQWTVEIYAPRTVIWNTLVGRDTFPEWCKPFGTNPIFFDGEWQLGHEIKYLTTNNEGQLAGMIGKIVEYREGELSRCQFFGYMENGEEIRGGDSEWVGSIEEYHLTGEESPHTLTVTSEVNDEMLAFFEATWPLALAELKRLAES